MIQGDTSSYPDLNFVLALAAFWASDTSPWCRNQLTKRSAEFQWAESDDIKITSCENEVSRKIGQGQNSLGGAVMQINTTINLRSSWRHRGSSTTIALYFDNDRSLAQVTRPNFDLNIQVLQLALILLVSYQSCDQVGNSNLSREVLPPSYVALLLCQLSTHFQIRPAVHRFPPNSLFP